ncbi:MULTISPECIES: VOC family protein [Sphingobium]|jgi:predicted enzyme related to lactoylglutathione lyase|uniref:Glyoxalase n=1 Tax=Sphingobium yanoikuyae TaxID=13690 RepID=A0A0J9FRZ9_SPHYA|nr:MULTISPECIES: VOC family protein [Sphingobium]ATP20685.1 glyoxalase [Sphingobium yanoikuyae]KMW31025.1 glyoxalase [Sphingobium yanoikuyae]TKV41154.1 glyoxalase [Sphingobium sp. MP9-4]
MTDFNGKFFWYELMTSDPAAALAFYGDVVGWTAEPFGGDLPDGPYQVISGSAGPLGGVMAIPAEAKDCGMTPWWGGYVGSADVDADAERLSAAGGSVKRPPEDIPGVGRFAVMADPGGAVFMLLKGSSPEGMDAPPPMAPGHVGWHELYAGDFDKDLAFYTGQLGWSKGEAMDMGEMGSYQLVSQTGSTDFDGMTGGIMLVPPMMPVPLWLFYFTVGDIDAAVERVTAGGGTVLQGPMEVPGGAWIIQATDPQGAMFALVGSKGEG